MKKRILALAATFIVLLCLFTAQADFGDFSADSDYGSSWDAGSWSGGGHSYDYDYDNIYGYVSPFHLFRFGGISSITIVLILAVIYFLYESSKTSKSSGKRARGAAPTDVSMLHPMAEYTALDPQFSSSDLESKLANMYVAFQEAWQAKNLETLRPYLTDTLYARCDRQIDAYRKNGWTNRMEHIAVLGVQLLGWKQEGGNDVIVARLQTKQIDYVTDDAIGTLVRGSNTKEKFMTYEWVLLRACGMTTAASSGTSVQQCPHCGAPVNINKTAKCDYCGSILTTDAMSWAVNEIKGLSQRTGS